MKYYWTIIAFVFMLLVTSLGYSCPGGNCPPAQAAPAAATPAAATPAPAEAPPVAAAAATPTADQGCNPDRSHIANHPDPRVLNLRQMWTVFPAVQGSLESLLQTYERNAPACISRGNIALTACMTCLSQHIQTGANVAQTALAALGGVSSATGQCNGIQDAAKYIQGALAAYQVACGGAKALCDSACSSAKSSMTSLKTALERIRANFARPTPCADNAIPFSPPGITTCAAYETAKANALRQITEALAVIDPELDQAQAGSIAKKTATCQGFALTLVSAASGIGSFALLSQQAKNCKKQTQATAQAAQDKCAPLPGKTVIETRLDNSCLASLCSKTEYSSRTECICYTNPRTNGCPSNLTPAGGDTPGGLQATSVDPNLSSLQASGTNLPGGSATGPVVNTRSSGSGTDGSKSTGSGTGAAPSAGLPGSGTAASTEVAPSATQRPSTAMYGSDYGGSGGSGSYSSYGSGGGGALRSYLPGGAQDPARNQASVSAAGVTSAGGKSNFEKITDRYVENRSTLSVTGR